MNEESDARPEAKKIVKDARTSLCLDLTRWLMMCEPHVLPRELQNHLRHEAKLQRTTHAGLCMPQYLACD